MRAERKVAIEPAGRADLLRAASDAMVDARSINVPLSAIAAKAGVSAPLVTHHFGTKERLQIELVRTVTAQAMQQMRDLLTLDLPPARKLRIHISGIVRTYARFPYLYDLLGLLQHDPASESAAIIRSEFVYPLMAAQRSIVEDGIAEGSFRPVNPDLLYSIITGAAQSPFSGKPQRWAGDSSIVNNADIRRYANLTADIVIAGLSELHPRWRDALPS